MTELWAIYACPYMGMHPYLDLIMSTDAHFSSYNAVIWELYIGYAHSSYKKGSIKKYYILGIL